MGDERLEVLLQESLAVAVKTDAVDVKVSVATTVARSRGGQLVLAAKALPGSPYDGHTLTPVIWHIEKIVCHEIQRIIADKGYRGHGLPAPYDMRVYVSEQRRAVTATIKRELSLRSAVESVIGHLKSEHRPSRNFLAGSTGHAINPILAAVGDNFARPIAWLRDLWCVLIVQACFLRAHRPTGTIGS